jgi:hypothetical protein
LPSRSPSSGIGALFRLDLGELVAARSFWLLLAMIGPLVGQAFLTAVASYGEASGAGGGPAALAQGLSPLDGIVVPTFGAYDLAVTFLLPFVAIRLLAAERETGAALLLAQSRLGLRARLTVKLAVLGLGGLAAAIPGLAALALWRSYGGHLAAPETANVLLGHLLHALLATSLAFAAAAVCRGSASAAIATLGLTVGGWALDFVAAGRSGWIAEAARFTPAAALRRFEHGELPLALLAALALATLGALAFAAFELDLYAKPAARHARAALGAVLAIVGIAGVSTLRSGWDLAEDRRNSFPRADEAALARIAQPVQVRANLAAEDPRLTDLDRNVLAKLRRVLPDFSVSLAAEGRSGLFDEPDYGEVWYQVGGKRAMLRSTIEPVVLAQIYELAGVAPPPAGTDAPYSGYPLAATPRGAAPLFYLAWPLVAGLAFFTRDRWRSQ